jgi:hypothetical protein
MDSTSCRYLVVANGDHFTAEILDGRQTLLLRTAKVVFLARLVLSTENGPGDTGQFASDPGPPTIKVAADGATGPTTE